MHKQRCANSIADINRSEYLWTLFLASSVVAQAVDNEQMELVPAPWSFSDCMSRATFIQTST